MECDQTDAHRNLQGQSRFTAPTQARTAVFDYLQGFYNPHRRHSTLGYLSPAEYERRHTIGYAVA